MNSLSPRRWPYFLIIGAPKAGTTALFRTLSDHPQIFASPEKEPRFFICSGSRPSYPCPGGDSNAASIVFPEEAYLELFNDCPADAKAGEASTAYLHHPDAPANAFAKVPSARIVAVLRHPVERGYSQWLHLRQEGFEKSADFETAWNLEQVFKEQGRRPSFYLRERGFYAQQLERWLGFFEREQILILFYEDWVNHPIDTINRICNHLGIADLDSPALRAENVSSRQPRWKWLHHRMVRDNALRQWAQGNLPLWIRDAITHSIQRLNLKPGPQMDPELRAKLAVTYHEDIQRLEELTGRDLTHWRQ